MIRQVSVCVAAVVALAGAASAQQLTAYMTVDNEFVAYVSTDDTINGTQFLTGNNWPSTHIGNYVFPGPGTYYLHVFARDLGRPEMFIGRFELDSPFATFVNNSQTLVTNSTDWLVSSTGFGSNYVAPLDIGANGIGPWGFFPQMTASARFIWHSATPVPNPVYFSTKIEVVPTPGTMALALMGAGLLARRRR